jgi:hypothetical protein
MKMNACASQIFKPIHNKNRMAAKPRMMYFIRLSGEESFLHVLVNKHSE